MLLLTCLHCIDCFMHGPIRSPLSLPRAARASLKTGWVALGAMGWRMQATAAKQPVLHRSGQSSPELLPATSQSRTYWAEIHGALFLLKKLGFFQGSLHLHDCYYKAGPAAAQQHQALHKALQLCPPSHNTALVKAM